MRAAFSHQPKILILGCDETQRLRLAQVICEFEKADAFQIFDCSAADEAMRIFKLEHPDLVIVEGCHEDGYGWDLCRFVREHEGDRHTGVIFKASRSGTEDKLAVTCLEMGADDFVRYGCSAAEVSARIHSVFRLKATTDKLRSVNHQLAVLSMTDELTGLANMRCFERQLNALRKNALSQGFGLGLFMIDLDHFKQVNDRFDHLMGSFVLAEVGKVLRNTLSEVQNCIAARYGGDEFIVAMRSETFEDLEKVGETIRKSIESHVFIKGRERLTISCSIGGSFIVGLEKTPIEEIIKTADQTLYAAKDLGRNTFSGKNMNAPTEEKDRKDANIPAWQVKNLIEAL